MLRTRIPLRPPPATTSATPTVYDIPITPDDFRMNIEVLEKKCFGRRGASLSSRCGPRS